MFELCVWSFVAICFASAFSFFLLQAEEHAENFLLFIRHIEYIRLNVVYFSLSSNSKDFY